MDVKVKMLVDTFHEGRKEKSKEYTVREEIAARWIKNKIAVKVAAPSIVKK